LLLLLLLRLGFAAVELVARNGSRLCLLCWGSSRSGL
jgi:hypothetical protein